MRSSNMVNPAVVERTLSKLAFCDLLLDTAVELERARAGSKINRAPLERLARVLARASKPFDDAAQSAFVEPTFYDSFERLFRVQKSEIPESAEQLQAFLSETVAELRLVETGAIAPGSLTKMIDFCVGLHQELTRELEAESGVVIDEWRTSDLPIAQSVG
jgi:hypothetical protein